MVMQCRNIGKGD